MTVDRTDITDAEGFDKAVANEETLKGLFCPVVGVAQRVEAYALGAALYGALGAVVAGARQHAPEVAGKGADVLRDRHLVVVQDDDEAACRCGDVVEGFEREAVREGGVANDRHDVLIAAEAVARHGHAERRRDGSAGVAGVEGVAGALAPLEEAGYAALLPKRRELGGAAGEELPGVTLVADVPDDPVAPGVKGGEKGYGQLNDTEAGSEVSAVAADGLEHGLAHLCGKGREVLRRERRL